MFILDRNTLSKLLAIIYKSNTDVRFVYIRSFIRIQNAINKYSANPKPKVTNVRYIKEVLTTRALIPNLSAMR